MIYTSFKNLLAKNDLAHIYWINLLESIMRHQTSHLTCIELRGICTACKSYRELSKLRASFAVNRWECFMEYKNIVRTFWAENLLKKNIELHQNFTRSYKKSCKGTGWTSRSIEYQWSKVKKVNKLRRKLSNMLKDTGLT